MDEGVFGNFTHAQIIFMMYRPHYTMLAFSLSVYLYIHAQGREYSLLHSQEILASLSKRAICVGMDEMQIMFRRFGRAFGLGRTLHFKHERVWEDVDG